MAAYCLTLWGLRQSSPLAGSWYTKLGAESSAATSRFPRPKGSSSARREIALFSSADTLSPFHSTSRFDPAT